MCPVLEVQDALRLQFTRMLGVRVLKLQCKVVAERKSTTLTRVATNHETLLQELEKFLASCTVGQLLDTLSRQVILRYHLVVAVLVHVDEVYMRRVEAYCRELQAM